MSRRPPRRGARLAGDQPDEEDERARARVECANFAHWVPFRRYYARSVSVRASYRLLFGVSMVLGAGVAGCPPGSLEDPERFLDGGAGGGSATCPTGYDVPKDLFAKKCVELCHDDSDPDGALDLKSANPASRMIGVASSDGDCATRLLIDPANPEQSFLIEKLTSKSPQCGDQMPDTLSKATASEIECVRQWVYGLVGGGDSGAAGSGGATDSGGGG